MAAEKPVQSERRYMVTGFHFVVNFDLEGKAGLKTSDTEPDVGFQEVSGLNASIETETFQEGGENRFSHRFPKPATYQNLVLKRGVLIGSKLIKWFKDAVQGFQFTPVTIRVSLLDESHKYLQTWDFINAYPVKWNIDAFNSQDGKIIAETIEISYQYFNQVQEYSNFLKDTGPPPPPLRKIQSI